MKYPRAPITEAIIDIRVTPRGDFDVERLTAMGVGISDEHGKRNDVFELTGMIQVSPGADPGSNATQRKTGFQFHPGKDRLLRAQLGGWSFHKLPPYDDWDHFRAEGRPFWESYREIALPTAITRLGLRYVNRIDLPLPFDDFKKYLLTVPEVAPGLPQGLANFFMQLQIPQEDIGALLVLNLVMVPPSQEGVASVVLDLDLFRSGDVPQGEDEIWVYFEQLRLRKNKVFESCITDATRELFR